MTNARNIRHAGQPHAEVEFRTHQIQHAADTDLASDSEAPQIGTADKDGARSEREGLQHVGAPTDAAVHVDFGLSPGGLDDFPQHVRRGDCAVELSAAVIRDHDPLRAVCHRQSRVVGRQNSLQHERQRAEISQPVNRFPRQARIPDVLDVLLEGRAIAAGLHLVEAVRFEVLPPQTGRQAELVANVSLASSDKRRIDGQTQSAIASSDGSLDQRSRDATVSIAVELKPAQPLRSGGGDFFKAVRGGGADNLNRPRRSCRPRHGQLPVGMSQRIEAARRGEDRKLNPLPQHRRTQVTLPDINEDSRLEGDLLPGSSIFTHGDFVIRSALVVIEDHPRQSLRRLSRVLVDVERFRLSWSGVCHGTGNRGCVRADESGIR